MSGLHVAYLGPDGTFSHLVAKKRYGRTSSSLVPCSNIEEVFNYTLEKPSHAGIVPIENSAGGTIYETVDRLIREVGQIFIQEELSLNVKLALVGRKGDDIHVLYSHFAPFHHCDEWLKRHLPMVKRQEVESTAEAVKRASAERGSAAIGTRLSAILYNLDVLKFPVESREPNVTQFFTIQRKSTNESGSQKSSYVIELANEPGALCSFLDPFGKAGINLSRILSRPIKGRPRTYHFFVDVLGTDRDPVVSEALESARRRCKRMERIGAYPIRNTYNS